LIRFGLFELDLEAAELRAHGQKSLLPEQQFQILQMLLLAEGGVISREAIRMRLWPDDTVVEFDRSINTAMMKLRMVLGDNGDKPHLIETLPRRGYRLMVPVDVEGNEVPGVPIQETPFAGQKAPQYYGSGVSAESMGVAYKGENTEHDFAAAEIHAHVARIGASPVFANSARLCELLRHTVAEAIAGHRSSLKESVLGVTVFGCKPGYDSDANSIVRVEFVRLRKKLDLYYEQEGANETLRVVFPRGSYAPEFVLPGRPAEPSFAGSVVVLPFTCLGSDPDDEYFADGLTDELITALTRFPGLKVVARTSSFMFKGRSDDIRGIGSALQVDTVLEGSVRRANELVRVHAQLVNVRDGYHIWAGKYERRLTAIFQLQDEIAAAIVGALKIELPRRFAASKRVVEPEAHALYLKGRFWWHRWNPEALRKAAGFFQQAIERDTGCAGAYSGLADCLFLQGYYGYGLPREVMPRAQEYARKAIEIDPLLGEAHCSLALLENAWEWNTKQCGVEFRRCLDLNPNYAMAVAKYATTYLHPIGRFEEGAAWLKRALILDPLSPLVRADHASNLVYRGLFDQFEKEAISILDDDSRMIRLYWLLGKSRAIQGNLAGAVEAVECALSHLPEDPITLGIAASVHGISGNEDRASELRGKIEFLSQIRYIPFAVRAFAQDEPGKGDAYFDLLDRAVGEHEPLLRGLRFMNRLTVLASDPRWSRILDRIGLGEQDVAQAPAIDLPG
jgi:TolB-like protein/DNA-binding winged helix-turn-helix (wHTH) protein